jgi:PAS domain S-box-containing protein
VDYLWPKPTPEGLTSLQKKLSYVELFADWGWVVGSGLYIDDIEAEERRKIDGMVHDLNKTLGSFKIGEAGYLFIFDGQDKILVHPSLAGRSLEGLSEPSSGRSMREVFREAAADPDHGIAYRWNKPGDEGNFGYLKRARVVHYKPLDWYIAATVYEDEELAPSRRLLGNLIILGSLILVVALVSCLPLVQGLVGPMTRLANTADRIAREGLDAASIPRGGTEEIRKLSDALAGMIASIRQSQSRLVESEEKYRSMMEAMEDMVFICSSDEVIEYMNPSLVRFVGKDATGTPCHETLGRFGGFCEGCGASGEPMGACSFRIVRLADGGHFHVTACPVSHPDGTTSMMSIIRDVTDQVLAEIRLRGAQRHIQSIINSMPSSVIGLDRDGRITLWNKEAALNFGLTPEDAFGHDMGLLAAELDFLRDMFQASIDSGETVKKNRLPMEFGGNRKHCDVTVYPLDGEGGAVVRIDDVSDLVRMEEAMVQSEKMLSVGGLAAGMAHEINNPLAGIVQNAQVIRQRLSGEFPANVTAAGECGTNLSQVNCYLERRHILAMLDMILDSGHRAARIVRNMLSFVRKSTDQKRPEDLAELMDQTLELAMNDYDLKKNYDFRQIEIVREYAHGTPKVLCESTKLQQVFMNLLKNGAQAMAEVTDRKPRFVLRIAGEGETVRVEVEDNGTGVSEAMRKRIFEPFFTTKSRGVGTGLGLSVSYFIVTDHHGGTMRVESVPGRMTRFIMHFPAARDNGGEGTEEGATPASA